MNTTPDLCIFYLADDRRQFYFPKFVKYFSDCKYLDRIVLLVLTHSNDREFYRGQLKGTKIQSFTFNFAIENNYMTKVSFATQFAKENNISYLMKHDNDILMSSYMYNYLYENRGVLEDPQNLILSPTLTTGIPSVEQFIDDFLDPSEQVLARHIFCDYTFETDTWGVDFSPLNAFTKDAKEWNSKAFFEGVKKINHHYRGIHPVRMHIPSILYIAQQTIQYKEKILGPGEFSLVKDTVSPYFCNSVYIIKRDVYETIQNDESLRVDAYDEVPLNKYREKNNLTLLYTKNGAAIHFMYNCLTHYILYEMKLINLL